MLFRKLRTRRRLDREMREEFEFHIQARAEELARSGMSREAARRQAAIEFGGIEKHKESVRDLRRVRLVEDLLRDLAYALRNVRREPLFALSAAMAVALGVAVNAALFSTLYALIFRPLPVRDPGSLRSVWMSVTGEQRRSSYGSRYFISYPEFKHIRSHAQTAEIAGLSEANLVTSAQPAGLRVQLASDNLLPMLGAHPAAGRFFTADETSRPGSAPVIVLSYAAWQRMFGGEDVVGRTLVANRTPFTIVGVADERTGGPLLMKADAWIPLTMQPITRAGEALIDQPTTAWIQVLARIRPGVADTQMSAEMEVLQQQALAGYTPGMKAKATVARAALFNSPEFMTEGVPVFEVLFIAVSLLLLAACANVANMLLARGLSRTRELAIRFSLGAGKARIVRQLTTENLVVAALGGVIGLALAQVVLRIAVSMLPEYAAGHQLDFAPDAWIVLWTMGVSLVAGALFGLPPAFGLLRRDLGLVSRVGAAAPRRRRKWSLQGGLIAAQVAVSAVLIVNAALLVRALATALNMDLGQATRDVLIVAPNVREMQYRQDEAQRYLDELRRRVASLPGVQAASLTGFDPYVSLCGTAVKLVGPNGPDARDLPSGCHEVGPEFFRAMRKTLLQGRAFGPADANVSEHVAIVDADFATRYLDGQALGKRFRIGSDTYEVVGVVASGKSLRRSRGAEIYFPFRGSRYMEGKLLVAYAGRIEPLAAAIRLESERLDRDLPITIKPIEQNVAETLGPVRAAAMAAGALGGIALLLAGAGVYGVIAFAVGRRRREIGIRMALGAERSAVLRLVAGQASRPVLGGAIIGIALAVASAQLIRTMLYGVSPIDPISLGAAIAVVTGAAAVASIAPARAALRVDPATTLRDE